MKYLKKFNESVTSLQEIQEICNDHFAYLIDDGFTVRITSPYTGGYNFEMKKEPMQAFKWQLVKDTFTSFIEIFTSDYKITDINFLTLRKNFILSKEDILEESPNIFIANDSKPAKGWRKEKNIAPIFDYSNGILLITFNIKI